MLRTHASAGQDVIEFAIPHTLAFTFFPAWVSALREGFGPLKSRLMALNVHDAVLRLIEGSCDLLIAYHHASQPLALDAEHYEVTSLGQEVLAPYSAPNERGAPLFMLPGSREHALPYLGYAPGAYLGQTVDQLLKTASGPVYLDRVYETDMSEGLKAMALQAHGVAFLPRSAVRREVEEGRLVPAVPQALATDLQAHLQILACRAKPTVRHPTKPLVDALWHFLTQKNQAQGVVPGGKPLTPR
jgi:DNA-binding transcriptional LysR family regulator